VQGGLNRLRIRSNGKFCGENMSFMFHCEKDNYTGKTLDYKVNLTPCLQETLLAATSISKSKRKITLKTGFIKSSTQVPAVT
jgi:hypothetical protein